jgi:hypothetical protein
MGKEFARARARARARAGSDARAGKLKPQSRSLAWWRALSAEQHRKVLAWLKRNPPPKGWTFSQMDWAFLEYDTF